MLTLQALNDAPAAEAVALLDGSYEHSPWVAQRALARRPFASLAALKLALVQTVHEAGREAQRALLRAHPELAGKAMIGRALTVHSAQEQGQAGLTHCTPAEFARLQELNTAYNAKFGWPFILAVRGPNPKAGGPGLTRAEIIATFERRLAEGVEDEFAECLRNVHRIAELRLNERFGHVPVLGQRVCDWADELAAHSDAGYHELGQLTVTYLTEAHRTCAQRLQWWMREAGCDEVQIDAVGNVVGIYHGRDRGLPRLLTGSHYDTVRDAGRYDGRLGILAPLAALRALHEQGRRLPFGIELVAFAEEEGQRFNAAFLGSSALAGSFDERWLDLPDADGVTLRQAMQGAGLPGTMGAVRACRRDPARYLGFVEMHIEQGPVLCEADLPLGVVSAINGSLRYLGELRGRASHAGTTPMGRRRDAACAVAALTLFVEARAAVVAGAVGTVGLLDVPGGSINVVPGRCRFSLDLRAGSDAVRDALAADVRAELERICAERGLAYTLTPTLVAPAAPCAAAWQARWAAAVRALGLPVHPLSSGAGHDAMKLHELMPQAMLFVRGGNLGLSHNPLESVSADDADLCVRAFLHLLEDLGAP